MSMCKILNSLILLSASTAFSQSSELAWTLSADRVPDEMARQATDTRLDDEFPLTPMFMAGIHGNNSIIGGGLGVGITYYATHWFMLRLAPMFHVDGLVDQDPDFRTWSVTQFTIPLTFVLTGPRNGHIHGYGRTLKAYLYGGATVQFGNEEEWDTGHPGRYVSPRYGGTFGFGGDVLGCGFMIGVISTKQYHPEYSFTFYYEVI
jgi:hypothetical protein